jgi:spermidine/putrescine transport system permease protein
MTARPVRPAVDRFAPIVEGGFRAHATLVYLFLFLPIIVVVVFSFNGTTRYVTDWAGFRHGLVPAGVRRSDGPERPAQQPHDRLRECHPRDRVRDDGRARLQRVPRKLRIAFDALTFVSIIVPEIVIALASLVLSPRSSGTGSILLAYLAGSGTTAVLTHGHVVRSSRRMCCSTLSLVLLIVRARLSDGPDACRRELRPARDAVADVPPGHPAQLLPAIVAGFPLSFTFSFDDYVISSFVSGSTETLPLVFGQVHQGHHATTNAIAAIMLLVTIAILLIGQAVLSRQSRSERRARVDAARDARGLRVGPVGPGSHAAEIGSGSRPGVGGEGGGLVGPLPGRSRSGRPKWLHDAVWR